MDNEKTLPELQSEFKQKDARINEILDKVGDDTPSKAQADELKELETDLTKIEEQVKSARERAESAKGARERAAGRKSVLATPEHRPGQGNSEKSGDTIGDIFNASIKSFVDSLKSADGNIKADRRIESPGVPMPGMLKSIISGLSDTSAGAFITADRQSNVTDRDPFRIVNLRDVITIGQTTSDTVEFVAITGHTNNAAPVAEATDSAGTSGTPNESNMAAVVETVTVKDVSHYVTMTKRAVSDAAQVKTYADNFLLDGVKDKCEQLMISGDGTGENFLGILNNPNIQNQPFVSDRFTTVRKARTKLRKKQIQPNAILMNADAWEGFDLEKDGNGQFYFGGPQVLGNQRAWGVPVIENEAIPDDIAIMADFRYATLWDRMVAELSMSDSPNNYFLRKLVAIMGSMRAAFGVLFPGAFIEISLAD